MSTAPVVLVAGTGAAAATWTTASFTPAANTRLIAYIAAFKATAGVALPTITDTGGLTWTLLASYVMSTYTNPDTRGDWFISSNVGGSPAARTVTITSTGGASIGVMVASVLSSEVSGTIVQAASGEDLVNGDPQIFFGSAPGATNITLLGTSHVGGSTVTGPTGYTLLCNSVHSAARKIACSYDITSASQNPQYTSLNARVIMLGIELAPPGGGGAHLKARTAGGTWVEKPVAVWSGTAWVQKTPKVWSGSAWISSALPPWTPPSSGPTSTLMTSFTPGADRNDFTGEVGVRLNMVANRTVSWVGMRCGTSNTGVKTVKIYEWFADALVATASIDMTGKTVGTFVWAAISPVTLAVGYYGLLASVVNGDGQWWSENAPTTFSATYTGNIYATYRTLGGSMAVTGTDMQFVGLDLGW